MLTIKTEVELSKIYNNTFGFDIVLFFLQLYRYRYCNTPHTAHGGKPCVGDGYDTQNCIQATCSGGSGKIKLFTL